MSDVSPELDALAASVQGDVTAATANFIGLLKNQALTADQQRDLATAVTTMAVNALAIKGGNNDPNCADGIAESQLVLQQITVTQEIKAAAAAQAAINQLLSSVIDDVIRGLIAVGIGALAAL